LLFNLIGLTSLWIVSEPGAVATGSGDPIHPLDPVATAPGSDTRAAL